MERKEWKKDCLLFVGSAILFFLVTMPFRQLFKVMAVTEVRPASALPPVFGLMFGWMGALGCAVGNLWADIISGYSPLLCAEGFLVQLFYGILPYLVWKRLDGEVRLNSAKKVLRYIVLIVFDSAATSLLLGIIMNAAGISALFSTATLLLFYNNFVFSMILGIPVIILITMRNRKKKQSVSLHERFVLIFLMLGVLSAGMIGIMSYVELSDIMVDQLSLWNRVYFYIAADLFVFNLATVLFLWYVEKQITTPLEGIAKIAREYVGAGRDRMDTGLIVKQCEQYSDAHGEAGDLAAAFKTMVRNLEQYIQNLTEITAEKERVGAELALAAQIQADMLPNIFPAFPDRKEIDIYAAMEPAKEVGGDFYDFFMVDDKHLAIVMADVSGKGVPAALFMVIGKTLIKDHTRAGVSLGDVFAEVNELLCQSNKEGLFITAFEGVLDLETGELVFVNAGHEKPFIYRKNKGSYEIYPTRAGFVLAGMEEMRYRPGVLMLERGDRIFLYTDGVTEATDGKNELYGKERLKEVLNENRLAKPEELLGKVKEDIDCFVGGAPQFDDITMLCMEFFGEATEEKSITVQAETGAMDEILDFVEEALEAAGCTKKVRMKIKIAVEEIYVNIANYAYPGGKGPVTITLDVGKASPEAVITFMDQGIPYNPLEKAEPDITLSAEERKIGGLGIYMVRKSMDCVEYEHKDGKNILKLQKSLK